MIILSYIKGNRSTGMEKIIMDILTNPTKCKIFIEIQKCKETTARHLSDTFSDIPPATLYRYLKKMTNDKVIKIVHQTQVRGTIEKTYAIAIDIKKEFQDILDTNSGEAYMQAFMQFILGFVELFQNYCHQDNIDIEKDGSGFSLNPLYLTDTELENIIRNIRGAIKPYDDNKPTKDRKLHSIGVIVSPPQK